MPSFPYYNEPTHDRGTVTNDANNAARSTATSQAEGRLVVDMVDRLFVLEPNQHPLVTLLTSVGKDYNGKSVSGAGLQKATTGNPKFSWLEDYHGGRYAKVATAYIAGATSIDVTGAGSSSAYIFTPGDQVKNQRTGEVMVVTSITDADTIAVSRAFGTTAAAAGVAGDGLFIVGNVSEENAGARNVNMTRAEEMYNYTQIFKTTIALSNTEKASDLYGGDDLTIQRRKKAVEHALDIERSFWLSERKYDVSGTQGKPRRSTGGILEFIESGNSYVQNQGGVLTAPDLNTFLREGFTYGNSTKVLFAGGVVIQAINEIARGQVRTKTGDTTYGVKISEWMTPFGSINIVHNPLFVEEYAGHAFLLDMESFRYRVMKGRDTALEMNIQGNDIDGQVDQYLSEVGLERKQAPKHALLKGVQA